MIDFHKREINLRMLDALDICLAGAHVQSQQSKTDIFRL